MISNEQSDAKTVTLGSEWDEPLRRDVERALAELGGECLDRESGVGGSQELIVSTWRLPAGEVVLESETYIGLTVSGPTSVVDAILARIGPVSG